MVVKLKGILHSCQRNSYFAFQIGNLIEIEISMTSSLEQHFGFLPHLAGDIFYFTFVENIQKFEDVDFVSVYWRAKDNIENKLFDCSFIDTAKWRFNCGAVSLFTSICYDDSSKIFDPSEENFTELEELRQVCENMNFEVPIFSKAIDDYISKSLDIFSLIFGKRTTIWMRYTF